VHLVEIGNGLVAFQLRGLEFRGEGGGSIPTRVHIGSKMEDKENKSYRV